MQTSMTELNTLKINIAKLSELIDKLEFIVREIDYSSTTK